MPDETASGGLSRRRFLRRSVWTAAGLSALNWLELCARTPAARAVPLDDEWQPPYEDPLEPAAMGCGPAAAACRCSSRERHHLRAPHRPIVCDGPQACFNGGPRCEQENLWRPSRMLIAQDPVALDTLGWLIIDSKRAALGLPSLQQLKRTPRYLATAAALGLGTNNVARMDLMSQDL
jgi:hypothetical protein